MSTSLPTITGSGELNARGLEVRAGGNTLLHGLDLRLYPGELCALIGPSGAGKSTLIRVLLGLRRPAAGSVTLADQPVGALGPVGYVPQEDALHGSLTVRQTLTFAAQLRLHAEPSLQERRIQEVVAQVGLHERLDVRVARLSGGQKKRVSVALELLQEPGLLILDEPTSGLDPGLEARLMELFAQVAAGGRVVMVATHAMQSLDRCHALAVLVAGRIAWFGPPAASLEWFRATSYADIFRQLPLRTPEAWDRAFRSSPARQNFVNRPRPVLATPSPAAAAIAGAPAPVNGPRPEPPVPPTPPDLRTQLEELKAARRQQRAPE